MNNNKYKFNEARDNRKRTFLRRKHALYTYIHIYKQTSNLYNIAHIKIK